MLPAHVLDCEVRWGASDSDHGVGTNRTMSPARKSAGGSRNGSNITLPVRPMMCQPPGVSSGYTAVCAPAIAPFAA